MNLLPGLWVAAVVPACVIGDTLEVPPLDRTGLLTAPRHGAAQLAGDVTVDGYTSEPGASVVVERWDAASRAWVTAGTAVAAMAADDPGAPMYAFHAAVAVGAGWPAGGLLSLRARVADVVLASLDAETETQHCIDAHTTWRDRLASCASGFPTLTLVDEAARPPELALAETVRGWYGGGAALTGAADPSVVPAAWRGPASAPTYRNAIATACRGCHASRSDALAFATPDQLRARAADIVQAICGAGNAAHAMPSAEASLARFWSGPARAYLAGLLGPEAVGACPPTSPRRISPAPSGC